MVLLRSALAGALSSSSSGSSSLLLMRRQSSNTAAAAIMGSSSSSSSSLSAILGATRQHQHQQQRQTYDPTSRPFAAAAAAATLLFGASSASATAQNDDNSGKKTNLRDTFQQRIRTNRFDPRIWIPTITRTTTNLIQLPISHCEASSGAKAERRRLAVDENDTAAPVEQQEDDKENKALKQQSQSSQPLRTCGPWCGDAAALNNETPCLMDPTIVPCQGSYCQTTAALWNLFVLQPQQQQRQALVSCDCYKAGTAYPLGAVPCNASCLIPEVQPARYPAPTGYGIFCAPGTCRPGASPRHSCPKLAKLECPCNWFGSECTSDWKAVTTAHVLGKGPSWRHLQLHIPDPDNVILQEDRPGSVVRLQRQDTRTGTIHEMAAAVARRRHLPLSSTCSTSDNASSWTTKDAATRAGTTVLQVLIVAPDPQLHPHVRYMAEYLLGLPTTTTTTTTTTNENDETNNCDNATIGGTFHVNPLISGFYNSHYQFLWDYMQQQQPTEDGAAVQDVILVATGSGISGIMSVIEHAQKCSSIVSHQDSDSSSNAPIRTVDNDDKRTTTTLSTATASDNTPNVPVRLHVYFGLRKTSSTTGQESMPYLKELQDLAAQGQIRLTLVESSSSGRGKDKNQPQKSTNASTQKQAKFYVQHAVQRDLETSVLNDKSNKLEPVFVACGNYQMIDDLRRIIGKAKASTRLFVNI